MPDPDDLLDGCGALWDHPGNLADDDILELVLTASIMDRSDRDAIRRRFLERLQDFRDV